MENLNILTGVQESDNYPYGGMTCHITFQVEFAPKKGYRFVTQTTNPKNGKINKPKKSTYYDFMVMIKNEKDHVKPFSFFIRGYDEVQSIINFLNDNEIQFTSEESYHLWLCVINCIRGNIPYTRRKFNVSLNDLLEVARVPLMIELFKKKADFNEIKTINYNVEEIKGLMD